MNKEQRAEGRLYYLKQSDVHKCPHYIMHPDHYRDNGSCRCDDLSNKDMIAYGYVWDGKSWVVPK